MGLFTRSIRPDDPTAPNDNDPAEAAPGTVGPPTAVPGDPHGVTVQATEPATTGWPPSIIRPSAWSGWPADWFTPNWSSHVGNLTDTAWACIDLNSRILATMPPYLVNEAPTLDADWLRNPQPDTYSSGWTEFIRSVFWDFQSVGEAYVFATSFYSTGWPARFHCIPPYLVDATLGNDGTRQYKIGNQPVSRTELLHIRYQGSVDDPHGHGPLEAGRSKLVAAQVLAQYGAGLASSGGIPSSVLIHPEQQSPEQSAQLKADWVLARQSSLGEPAVLSGGITWQPTNITPREMALLELLEFNESRIAILLGVPAEMVGLPGGKDSLTYSTTQQLAQHHYNAGLRPLAKMVTAALSEWLLPRGTMIELNEESYVRDDPKTRAETYAILAGILDAEGNPVLSAGQIRQAERFRAAAPTEIGVMG